MRPDPSLDLSQAAHECARPRAGDGAEIVDQLLPVHAEAGVGDGQRPGLGVGLDADRQRAALRQQFWLGDRLVAQLVAGIGGV